MPQKLKTYVTSQGFFDLAIAAPSMKAALEARGSNINLFHKGFAKETDDPKVVAATMEKPGVTLQRPVGTQERFSDHEHLPKNLPPMGRSAERPPQKARQPRKRVTREIDDKAAAKAAAAYDEERGRSERQRAKEEARRSKERARRDRAIDKVQAQLDAARQDHGAKLETIENARAELDKQADAETARWDAIKERLETALRSARS
jgi:colicin import membrane protein